MFMSARALVMLGLKPRGVLHVGAHEGEESERYTANRWGPVTWVEMLPDKADFLRQKFARSPLENIVVEAACWDSEVDLTVHRGSGGTSAQASSLLAPGSHLTIHPEVSFSPGITVRTTRLDTILPLSTKFELINIDVQGAELRVLNGLGDRMSEVRWAYIEVNDEEVYKGCALLPEIDAFMARYGLTRLARVMCSGAGWGDALYAKTTDLSPLQRRWLKLRSWVYYFWGQWRWKSSMRPWDNWAH